MLSLTHDGLRHIKCRKPHAEQCLASVHEAQSGVW